MKCEGFPSKRCPDGANSTNDMLGYQLCDVCAAKWRAPDPEVGQLHDQLAHLHEAVGCARALLSQQSYGAAEIVLEEAMKGKR